MKLLLAPVKLLGFACGVALLGIGIPLLWVFIASQLAHTTLKIELLPLFVMVVGMLASYIGVTALVSRLDKERQSIGAPRMAWNRSLGAERHQGARTTQWERLFMTTVVITAILFEIWFFVFAGSSLPHGTGT
jgi:uncharacterized membrane protein YedE/YeeE